VNLKKCVAAMIAGDNGFAVSLHRVADAACGGRTVWLAHRDADFDDAIDPQG